MKKLITLLLVAFSFSGFAQQLVSDSTFGVNGLTNVTGNLQMAMNTVLHQPDGKLIFCGYTQETGCNCFYNTMFRIDACGNIDSSFGVNGYVQHTFDQRNAGYTYALQPDGKIIAAGMQSDGNAGSQQFPFVARYKSNGTPDSTFGTNGTNKISNLGPGEFHMVSIESNGKLFCANGLFSMRFNSDGTVDATYGTSGHKVNALPSYMWFTYNFTHVVRPDGKIVAGARGVPNSGNSSVLLACFDTTGTMDSTFGTDGFYFDVLSEIGGSDGPPLKCQSNNKVLCMRVGAPEFIVVRYKANGSIDSTFAVDGFMHVGGNVCQYMEFDMLNNDAFLVTINEASGGGPIMRKYTANGTQDLNLTINGSTAFDFNSFPNPQIAIASSNGELMIAGTSSAGANTHIVGKYQENSFVPSISQTGNVLNSNVTNTGATYQWLLDGNEITGETNSTLTITTDGTYTVVVTNIWGCDATDAFVVSGLGIDAIENNSVSVYPVPASSNVTVQFSKSISAATISLYDLIGKKVFEIQVSNISTTKIDVTAFAKGVYNLQIISADGKSNHKIIVQ